MIKKSYLQALFLTSYYDNFIIIKDELLNYLRSLPSYSSSCGRCSYNSTCPMTGVGKHTVLRLLKDMGCACAAYGPVRRGWS